jgi:hypothetical protein
VKSPKGFGKRYFTLAAILAYSITPRLRNLAVRFDFYLKKKFFDTDEEQEENEASPPFLQTLQPCSFLKVHPCHCNCLFALKTKLAIALFHYIPRCPFYNTYFAFRRTGVHPPFLSSFLIHKI